MIWCKLPECPVCPVLYADMIRFHVKWDTSYGKGGPTAPVDFEVGMPLAYNTVALLDEPSAICDVCSDFATYVGPGTMGSEFWCAKCKKGFCEET
jgi:hypothetical protein